jgi:hypothetical protein
MIENSLATNLTLDETALFKLSQVIADMLPAPTMNAPNLRRIILNLKSFQDRNDMGPNSTEVKFDF